MQLIAEIYDILKELAGLDNEKMAQVFDDWNKGKVACVWECGDEGGCVCGRESVCMSKCVYVSGRARWYECMSARYR